MNQQEAQDRTAPWKQRSRKILGEAHLFWLKTILRCLSLQHNTTRVSCAQSYLVGIALKLCTKGEQDCKGEKQPEAADSVYSMTYAQNAA